MLKLLSTMLFLATCCVNSHAQTSGPDRDVVQTLAGTLSISRVERVRADSVTFNVSLKGAHFDQYYGSHYAYYVDSSTNSKPVGRMIVEDFNGGASEPPLVSMYDFRKQSPVVLSVSDKLDLDDVRWTADAVFLSTSGRWYAFAHKRLLRSPLPKNATP
ncbi:hypothetical protein [Paraburkholderia nemoris]|uniref:hypothetical protein n=1 Tax=Paraburkholderia nemoris TaxID=2793076 RepID=UPI001B096D9E|nr:hypothetical protein [Paraburkholderia nemoris]CAE6792881.1 hypothetical protein LMG22931_05038 [Paraburkholderia nemoris]